MKCHLRLAVIAVLASAAAAQGGEPPSAPTHPALQPLNDSEMRAVTRPLNWRLSAVAPATTTISLRPKNPLYSFGGSAVLNLHALNLLVADVEIRDVVFNKTREWSAASDGIYNVPLPSTIGEIDIRNIRTGPGEGFSFGSMQIKGIDLQNTAITVSPNNASRAGTVPR